MVVPSTTTLKHPSSSTPGPRSVPTLSQVLYILTTSLFDELVFVCTHNCTMCTVVMLPMFCPTFLLTDSPPWLTQPTWSSVRQPCIPPTQDGTHWAWPGGSWGTTFFIYCGNIVIQMKNDLHENASTWKLNKKRHQNTITTRKACFFNLVEEADFSGSWAKTMVSGQDSRGKRRFHFACGLIKKGNLFIYLWNSWRYVSLLK